MNSTTNKHQTIAHYLLYKHHLTLLFASLKQNQIEFIIFKGWSFIPDLYPDPALRPFTDVDILINPADYAETFRVMEEQGFIVKRDTKGIIPLEITFSHQVGVHIDLHTHILQLAWWHPAFPIELDEVWHTAQPYLDSTGLSLKRFSPEVTFLHLCLHLFNHGIFNTQFHMYKDIERLVDKYSVEMDWDYVAQKAKEWGLQNMVHWVAKTFKEEFNITLPVTFQSKASRKSVQYRLIKSYFDARYQPHKAKPWRTAFLLRLALIDDLSNLPKLLFSSLFPSPALRAIIHNQPCSLFDHWRKYGYRLLHQ
ncbi:MAG TPA: hypothetical protein DD636_07990 [Anaerolineaceae bacterium]|jgi:hypothetical protein|nr:hypothetical protein [Anaerolineaceae bacterium]